MGSMVSASPTDITNPISTYGDPTNGKEIAVVLTLSLGPFAMHQDVYFIFF